MQLDYIGHAWFHSHQVSESEASLKPVGLNFNFVDEPLEDIDWCDSYDIVMLRKWGRLVSMETFRICGNDKFGMVHWIPYKISSGKFICTVYC